MNEFTENLNQQEQLPVELPEELAVAVIGMSGRFPGAGDVQQFWQNLAAGTESISVFDDQQLLAKGVDPALLGHDAFVKAGSFIEDIEWFDASFFDMTPREAQITDPQHRVLLECAWQAMENGGYVGNNHDGAIALYAGVGLNTYLINNIMPNRQLLQTMGMHQLLLGNDKCYATSRIAYKLNLKGPCMTIDTACSSSLVSILTAYKSLISYDCDMALAGGAKVNAADTGYLYEPGSINSPDGHCRAFDAQANGTVFGSGAGMVLLKRLDDALEDKDNIIGIIRGGAINNDGSDKVGFTAPSVNRQRDVIEQALTFTEVPASSISYVEAHGTGTRLGDPVELNALTEAFEGAARQSCYIGSAKTNIGHLESAAGVTGLIKVLSSMNHELLPPSLNYNTPNPAIDFANSPFKVVSEATPWPRTDIPRRACVSSFGLGGTNAHLVVEEAPQRPLDNRETLDDQQHSELLLLSTKCPASLAQAQNRLSQLIQSGQAPLLKDAAYTLAVGRQNFSRRSFALAQGHNKPGFVPPLNADTAVAKTAWVIPGQGTQYPGMSHALYQRFAVFADTVDQCCDLLVAMGGTNLKPLLLATEQQTDAAQTLNQTINAQPAIFVHAYAMAKQLQAFGMQPELMLGHSLGEYVVACLAEVLSLNDALRLVYARAKLMNAVPSGSMAVISAPLAEVQRLLSQNNSKIDIAAINAPQSIVISGPDAAIEQILPQFGAANIDNRKLTTSHAFHSQMMEPILTAFSATVSQIQFAPAQLAYVSSLTGELVSDSQIANPDYWVNHLRQTVQFGHAVQTLLNQNVDSVLDLGPSTSAAMLVRANTTTVPVINCSANVKQQTPADEVLLMALGQFWCHGGQIDWQAYYQERDCYRVALPGYPFQRQKHWVDPIAAQAREQVQTPPTESQPAVVATAESYDGAPRNETEQMIADIWQQLLGLEQIRIDHNFFNLGGQSLLATRVMSSIFEHSGIELDVSILFDSPTIEGLSLALIEQQLLGSDDDELERMLAEMEQ